MLENYLKISDTTGVATNQKQKIIDIPKNNHNDQIQGLGDLLLLHGDTDMCEISHRGDTIISDCQAAERPVISVK